MSLKPKAESTHTSDAFVDFAYDLLEYAMPKYSFVFSKPSDYERRSPKLFRDGFGDVVILFRSRNRQEFHKLFSSVADMDDTEDMLVYVARIRDGIFKGAIPLMEFISYCAFLLDIGQLCFHLEDPDLLYNIVDDTVVVFHRHIKPYFTIVGGWFALYRVAKQYKMYATFDPASNPAVSVENEDFLVHESGDLIKF